MYNLKIFQNIDCKGSTHWIKVLQPHLNVLKQKHIFNTYKAKLTQVKEETEIFTNTVRNFNTSLFTIDKIEQKKY